MSLTLAGLTALGIAASKGHDMYLAGCDVLGADDREVEQLAQAMKLEAAQQELQNASAPKPASRPHVVEKKSDSMSAGSMLMIAGGLTVGVLALAAVLGRRRD